MNKLLDHWPLLQEAILYDSTSRNTKLISPSELEDLTEEDTSQDVLELDDVEFDSLEDLAEQAPIFDDLELEAELKKPENTQYYEQEEDEEEYTLLMLDWYDEDDYNEVDLELLFEEDTTKADTALHQKDAVIYFLQMKMDPATMASTLYNPDSEEDIGQNGMYMEALQYSLS